MGRKWVPIAVFVILIATLGFQLRQSEARNQAMRQQIDQQKLHNQEIQKGIEEAQQGIEQVRLLADRCLNLPINTAPIK
jgi:hypothetical protein